MLVKRWEMMSYNQAECFDLTDDLIVMQSAGSLLICMLVIYVHAHVKKQDNMQEDRTYN